MDATDQASQATTDVFANGIGNVMANQAGWTNTSGSNYTYNGVTGVNMSGTMSGTNPTAYSLTFVYTNFYSNGLTINGTVTLSANEYTSSRNGTVSANNLTFSGGVVTTQSWNANWTTAAAMNWINAPAMDWTGIVTSNGTAIDPKTLYFK